MRKSIIIIVISGVVTAAALLLFTGERGVRSQQESLSGCPAPSPVTTASLPPISSPGSPTPASAPTPGLPKQELNGGFIRYIPNRSGDIEWKMEGTSVHFVNPTCLEIADLTATSVAPKIGDLTISVGRLLFHTDSNRARADEERITVNRENMILTGKGFLWISRDEQIRVFEDVKFLIKEGGNQGLFPL